MPIVQSTQTQSQSTTSGLSWSKIKELANKRTDRRGEKTLDLDYELLAVLSDFCTEQQWYWRRLTSSINTVAGTGVYDLTDPNIEVEKIIRAYCISAPQQKAQLSLITDNDEMVNMLESFDTPAAPGKFMREPGTTNSIRINTPDAVYDLRFLFWAVPAINTDALTDAVPLVPSRYHHILVKGLEAAIFRYALGEGAAKYQAAAGEYQRLVSKAGENRDGAVGVVREYTSSEPGIRSTNLYRGGR